VVQFKTDGAASAVLAPKVRGTLLLAEVLKDEPLDFFALFSNSLGLTGAAGQVDYCAASAFLDAFAHGGARGETFTVAVDWYLPRWEEWDASGAGVGAEFTEARALYGISLREGVEAFARVLGGTEPQVVVSTQDFPALLVRQRGEGRAVLGEQLEAARAAGGGAVGGEVEETMAAIWRQLFGVEAVGADDNFFDLGGNSLLAIQLVAQLRKAVGAELPLSSLFGAPTVAGMAALVREIQLKEQEAAEIERLLQEIESLSPEELQASLSREALPGDGND
jgi:acyl carrier protein